MSTDQITNEIKGSSENKDNSEANAREYRSTRLVCAKLYSGGLFEARRISKRLKRSPFKGKSPEFEFNIDLVNKHAKAACRYHLVLIIIPIILSLLGLLAMFRFQDPVLSSMFSVPAIFILALKPSYDMHIALNNFSRKAFNPYYNLSRAAIKENKEKSKDIEEIQNKSDYMGQNVIVFEDYFPFLGAGYRIRGRNFIINLSELYPDIPDKQNNPASQPEDALSEKDSQLLKALYKAVREGVKNKRLPNTSVSCFLLADGDEIYKHKFLFHENTGDPIAYLKPDTLFPEGHKDILKDYRAYISIRFHDRVRSILLSAFVRFSKVGKEIFAEYSFYLLPPVNEDIYDIDKYPINKSAFTLKPFFYAFFFSTAYILLAPSLIVPVALLSYTVLTIIRLYRNKESDIDERALRCGQIRRGELYNYGLKKTFREEIALTDCKKYFDAQDLNMIQNSIEKSILNSVADVLDARGLDSSLLRKNMIPQVDQNTMTFSGKINLEKSELENEIQISGQKMVRIFYKIYSYFIKSKLWRNIFKYREN